MHSVLLTGATGFVGAFVLYELLQVPQVQVTCLLRGVDDAAARSRLRAVLTGWELDVDWQRVTVISGNLAAEKLGGSAARWEMLAATVDCIIHCGGEVQHTRGYDSLRQANVGGTIEILRLAAAGRAKRLCLLSTLDVTGATPDATEETQLAPPWKGSGYTQTKWVAERLALAAAAIGHDVSICRLGLVLGDTAKGRVQIAGYWATQALRACVRTGSVPAGLELPLHAIPIDLAARGIVAEALFGGARVVTHLGGQNSLTTAVLVEALRELDIVSEALPRDQWLAKVGEAAATDPELARFLLLSNARGSDSLARTAVHTGEALLKELGLVQPPLKNLIMANLRYLQETGAL